MTEHSKFPEDFSDLDNVDWSLLEADATDNAESEGVTRTSITPEMLAKRITWDVVPCDMAPEVAKAQGLQAASEDVEEMEHMESHQRLIHASIIGPFVWAMAAHAASAVVTGMVLHEEHPVPEELVKDAIEKQSNVIFQTTFAIVAELLDVGALHLPHYGIVKISEEDLKNMSQEDLQNLGLPTDEEGQGE